MMAFTSRFTASTFASTFTLTPEHIRNHMTMRALFTQYTLLTALVTALATPLTAIAQEQAQEQYWYQFDVLVFSQNSQSSIQEAMPKVAHHPIPVDAVRLKSATTPNLDNEDPVLLPGTLSKLQKETRKLNNARGYKILWKGSWRMPLVREGDTVSILVEGGKHIDHDYELEGTMTFSLRRYLHVHTNLWVSELTPVQPSENLFTETSVRASTELYSQTTSQQSPVHALLPENLPYSSNRPFKASQRLQLNKLIYIDNPDAGILLKVTPWKESKDVL